MKTKIALFCFLSVAGGVKAANLRRVSDGDLTPQNSAAVNQNFKAMNDEMRNSVHKTGNETIHGEKTFRNDVKMGGNLSIKGPRPWVDITAAPYNAKCDGTDDAPEIQAAIDAVTPPGEVFVPSGCTFHTYSALVINKNNVVLTGVGQNASIIQYHGTGDFLTINSSSTALYYIGVKDLEIDSLDASTTTVGIHITGANGVNLSDFSSIHLRGFYTGILNDSSAANYGHNHFIGNRMDNYGANGTVYGFRYTGGHTVGEIISGNTVIVSSYGFHMVDGGASAVGIGDILISGNYFSNGIYGVYLEGNPSNYHHNFRITANQFIDQSSYTVYMKSVGGSTIMGNTFAVGATTLDPVFQDSDCDTNLVDSYPGGFILGGALSYGVKTSQTGYPFYYRIGTNKNFAIGDSVSLTGATTLNFMNDIGNQNTGAEIRSSTTAFYQNGNLSLYLDSSGKAGVGIPPISGIFQAKAATDQDLIIGGEIDMPDAVSINAVNDANSANIPLEIRSSKTNFSTGNVGIMTSSPLSLFHVAGSESANTRGITSMQNDVNNRGAVVGLLRSSGTLTSPAAIPINSTLGILQWGGYDGVDYGSIDAMIFVQATEDFSSGHHGTKMMFRTTAVGAASPTTYLTINSTGYITAPGIYNQTDASASNVYVDSSGNLFRSTSARKYKDGISPLNSGLSDLLTLHPVTFYGKNDEKKRKHAGFIADDIPESLDVFVTYGPDGEVEGLEYANMAALFVNAFKDMKKEIDDLKTELEKLKK